MVTRTTVLRYRSNGINTKQLIKERRAVATKPRDVFVYDPACGSRDTQRLVYSSISQSVIHLS